jgi:hypothetical protein
MDRSKILDWITAEEAIEHDKFIRLDRAYSEEGYRERITFDDGLLDSSGSFLAVYPRFAGLAVRIVRELRLRADEHLMRKYLRTLPDPFLAALSTIEPTKAMRTIREDGAKNLRIETKSDPTQAVARAMASFHSFEYTRMGESPEVFARGDGLAELVVDDYPCQTLDFYDLEAHDDGVRQFAEALAARARNKPIQEAK